MKFKIGGWAQIKDGQYKKEKGRIIGFRNNHCEILRTDVTGDEVIVDYSDDDEWCFMRDYGEFHWFLKDELIAIKIPLGISTSEFKAPKEPG